MMEPYPELRTARLILREFSLEDAPEVQRLVGEWEVARPLPIGLGPEVPLRHGVVPSSSGYRWQMRPPERCLVGQNPRPPLSFCLVHRCVRLRKKVPKVVLARVPVRPHADAQHQLLSPG
jgi:hypothetical protein